MKITHKPVSDAASKLRVACLLSAATFLTGCANLDSVAPPVTMVSMRGKDAASLESGRRIYLENCTHCHAPEPVRDYSAARWPAIIADMSERSRLSAAQHNDVLAYVLAATQGR